MNIAGPIICLTLAAGTIYIAIRMVILGVNTHHENITTSGIVYIIIGTALVFLTCVAAGWIF